MEKWECHICKEDREDKFISVLTTDISLKYNLPKGSMKQNVRFCNDKKICINKSKTFSLL